MSGFSLPSLLFETAALALWLSWLLTRGCPTLLSPRHDDFFSLIACQKQKHRRGVYFRELPLVSRSDGAPWRALLSVRLYFADEWGKIGMSKRRILPDESGIRL